MSLAAFNLNVIGKALGKIKSEGLPMRRVASLGYPDILVRPEQIVRLLGEDVAARIVHRDDSADILRWHHVAQTFPVPEATSLFAALGFELEVIDVARVRGGELVHDLNQPLPAELERRYAMAIDAGTLEHCFNIGQAAINVAGLVEVGGFVLHGNPINMFNHGFYNLNPLWYYEFYEANGFKLELAMMVSGPFYRPDVEPAPLTERFRDIAEDSVAVALARRTEVRPLIFPIQGKYLHNPTQTEPA